ncbi:MAG: hypothetical protein IIY94_04515 [Oscillospiraceae bacterium]|nr:hypothetical protein [Oscillospiraceae bacterium]
MLSDASRMVLCACGALLEGSVDACWHPLTPEHGFPSLIYKAQGAPPQPATLVDGISSFRKGIKKQETALPGRLL